MRFSTHRKKRNERFSYNMLKTNKPFWKLGLLCLDYLLKHLHEFYGVEKRTRVNLKSLVTSALHALAMLSHSRSLSKCSLILQLPHEWAAKQLCPLFFVWKKNFFFKVAEPPRGRLLMLGREGLQLHYLIKFVSKCNWSCKPKLLNCLWFWRVLILSLERDVSLH